MKEKKLEYKECDKLCTENSDVMAAYAFCMDTGFEALGGCCGHDAGYTGIIGVILAWERVRNDNLATKMKDFDASR